jgi:hypothetical protein
MSSVLALDIPSDVVEESIRASLGLEEPIALWGVGWDEIALCLKLIVEVDDADAFRLEASGVHIREPEDGELVQ